MTGHPVPEPAAAAEAPKPVTAPPGPPADTWLRSILTDREGQWDLGSFATVVVALTMCGFQAWALHKGQPFDPLSFGGGVGVVLGGLGFYKIGDRPGMRPRGSPSRFPPGAHDDQDRYG